MLVDKVVQLFQNNQNGVLSTNLSQNVRKTLFSRQILHNYTRKNVKPREYCGICTILQGFNQIFR